MVTLDDIHLAFGRAAQRAQLLEAHLKSLLLLVATAHEIRKAAGRGFSGLELPELTVLLLQGLEKNRPLTLGTVREPLVKQGIRFTDEDAEKLSLAVKARNYLMHQFYAENCERLLTPDGRSAVVQVLPVLDGVIEKALTAATRLYRESCRLVGWSPESLLSILVGDVAYTMELN